MRYLQLYENFRKDHDQLQGEIGMHEEQMQILHERIRQETKRQRQLILNLFDQLKVKQGEKEVLEVGVELSDEEGLDKIVFRQNIHWAIFQNHEASIESAFGGYLALWMDCLQVKFPEYFEGQEMGFFINQQ